MQVAVAPQQEASRRPTWPLGTGRPTFSREPAQFHLAPQLEVAAAAAAAKWLRQGRTDRPRARSLASDANGGAQ